MHQYCYQCSCYINGFAMKTLICYMICTVIVSMLLTMFKLEFEIKKSIYIRYEISRILEYLRYIHQIIL